MADLLEEEMGKGSFRPLLHCYTGGADLARRAARLGAWFSASGIVTFKKAEDVRAVFRDEVPDDRVILETDCPYLAPVPHRGKRCEPAFLPDVAAGLAAVKGWTVEDCAARTTQAALNLFDRIEKPVTGLVRITLLGTGSSGGVPRANGDWGDCNPNNPRNRRRRCSALVERARDPCRSGWRGGGDPGRDRYVARLPGADAVSPGDPDRRCRPDP